MCTGRKVSPGYGRVIENAGKAVQSGNAEQLESSNVRLGWFHIKQRPEKCVPKLHSNTELQQ